MLYPAGGYSFSATGQDQYQVTYPLAVLEALIDETHRLGRKAGCHVYGGEGQKNAIIAGCDTIEHGFGLNQEQIKTMAAKGLYYEPTLVRCMEPYMDDADAKNISRSPRRHALLRCAQLRIVPDNLPALHHELHTLQFCDVGHGIARNRDQIGVLALVDGSDRTRRGFHLRTLLVMLSALK